MKKIIDSIIPVLIFILIKYLLNCLLSLINPCIEINNISSAILLPIIVYLYHNDKKTLYITIPLSVLSVIFNKVTLLFIGLIGPLNEEIIYREFAYKRKDVALLIISSLLFMAGHNGTANMIMSFALGVILCLIKDRFNLKACIAAHALINILLFIAK